MRVLFTCVVGYGHFHPLVPLAQAMATAGHEVAFATDPGFCPYVASLGFEAFPAGLDHAEALRRFLASVPDWESVPPDERPRLMFPGMFSAVRVPAMLPDLRSLIERWGPDLLIHDTNEMAGALAAEVAGIPHVDHSFGIIRPAVLAARAVELRAAIVAQLGIRDPGIAGQGGEPFIDICPPSLQLPDITGVAHRLPLRPVSFDPGPSAALPGWVETLPQRPTVYLTMGTVFNRDQPAFGVMLEALWELPLNVIVTVGADGDPAALGEQPDHVHVERFIPQSLLLPHCDLVVSHAGSGATLGALGAGLPMLALPQGADQFINAQRLVAVGAGLALAPAAVTVEAVRVGVRRLLEEPSFLAGARAVRREIEAMPPPEALVPTLEAMAEGRAAPQPSAKGA